MMQSLVGKCANCRTGEPDLEAWRIDHDLAESRISEEIRPVTEFVPSDYPISSFSGRS